MLGGGSPAKQVWAYRSGSGECVIPARRSKMKVFEIKTCYGIVEYVWAGNALWRKEEFVCMESQRIASAEDAERLWEREAREKPSRV